MAYHSNQLSFDKFSALDPSCMAVDLSNKGGRILHPTSAIPHNQMTLSLRTNQPHVSRALAYCTPNPVPNLPENNHVHVLHYRGAQIAAFTVGGRELICLPQAFELFLKHLVGGLHTVYTKLKRLEIVPVVCNVEQVRILRGLGAIQPGVNRCKLIAPHEFDVLYADCTNSSARPGRPSKRFISSSSSPSNPTSDRLMEPLIKTARATALGNSMETTRWLLPSRMNNEFRFSKNNDTLSIQPTVGLNTDIFGYNVARNFSQNANNTNGSIENDSGKDECVNTRMRIDLFPPEGKGHLETLEEYLLLNRSTRAVKNNFDQFSDKVESVQSESSNAQWNGNTEVTARNLNSQIEKRNKISTPMFQYANANENLAKFSRRNSEEKIKFSASMLAGSPEDQIDDDAEKIGFTVPSKPIKSDVVEQGDNAEHDDGLNFNLFETKKLSLFHFDAVLSDLMKIYRTNGVDLQTLASISAKSNNGNASHGSLDISSSAESDSTLSSETLDRMTFGKHSLTTIENINQFAGSITDKSEFFTGFDQNTTPKFLTPGYYLWLQFMARTFIEQYATWNNPLQAENSCENSNECTKS